MKFKKWNNADWPNPLWNQRKLCVVMNKNPIPMSKKINAHYIFYLDFLVSVLLSAHVERFSVSRMLDLLWTLSIHATTNIGLSFIMAVPRAVVQWASTAEQWTSSQLSISNETWNMDSITCYTLCPRTLFDSKHKPKKMNNRILVW